jgi:hypothetical protein
VSSSSNGITETQNIFLSVIAALVIGSALPYQKLIEPLEGETDNWREVAEEPF